ncbi:MAG: hypothetical protein CO186_06985 [Zetaproteobacteria bacterium CG_4_9_14_3_um_filter_49_83]|nr:MAG: hypothetical protein AUJ56_04850 [Zetaproteobacteria bacterium CG1_02_49_23]PIQ33940.1 MAG: hypothetical protein COW62_03870 [Zetaproteobacteria bacterium CG17_big_fil_post_rev_8_21_14_2_50_50_13]PIV30180.1 MAG: hypothetical protein COS35_08155 [Zetaproteobacteria bacterium CG02_land_8_20_14_3_00_50_9]PIY54870.1 MAG: hypothetical protein COZ00_12575 [Zetaproteobacteria bacterium CG_4_10_14_0_8_um_filter_49_80]PJA35204.1 MAG: hypothetical protein CO186_06985 [Zetaproteobacteria bacterium
MLKSEGDIVFEETARKAEQLAKANAGSYKVRLFLFAILGYMVIFGILASLFGLVGGLGWLAFSSSSLLIMLLLKKKLILLIAPTIWVLLKALWVRFEQPQGYELKRQQAPLLFNELDELQLRLNAPKIHRVLLEPEFNASISQTPRLGIFGWQRNTLTLGLELLLVLSPEQARAVIAHEFGHLSGNHSRFSGWIYRVRVTWGTLMEAFHQQQSWGAGLMCRFFDWYAPRFAAYSFALARSNEYEADAISAQLTSPESTKKALVNSYVTSSYINNHYWGHFFEQADTLPEPPHGPWQGLHGFLSEHEMAAAKLEEMLHHELQVETAYHNTHPALADRVRALTGGADSELEAKPLSSVQETAAYSWFGGEYETIIQQFDHQWMENIGSQWRERFDYVKQSREKMAGFHAKPVSDLSDEELWQLARFTEEFEGGVASLTYYDAFQQRHPDDADAGLIVGRILYDKNDEALLTQMKKALAHPAHVIEACEYAYYFLTRNERHEEANWWKQRAEEQVRIDAASEAERSELMPKDPMKRADIPIEMRQAIIDALAAHPKVKSAWMAEKVMQHYPEFPAVAIVVKLGGFIINEDKVVSELLDELEIDGTIFIVPKKREYKKLTKAIIKVGVRIV